MPQSSLRLIIVGAGNRSAGWFAPFAARNPESTIAALVDAVPAKAAHLASTLPGDAPPIYPNLEDALAAVKCDAVAVLTSDAHHAEVVLPALAAGKTVFCEKPLETTLPRCKAIVAADEKAGGRVFVGFNLRYAPVYEAVQRELRAGRIGRLLTIQADEFYDGGRTYFRRWNRLRAEGGGLWITKASHDFDLLQWLAGTAPLAVSAQSSLTHYTAKAGAAALCRDCALAAECPDRAPAEPSPLARIWEEDGGPPHDLCLYNSEKDTFDHGIATVRFAEDILATYTCNVVSGFSDRRLRVSGTKGTIDASLGGETLVLTERDPSRVSELPVGGTRDLHGGADDFVFDSFLAFARGQGAPKCRPREAITAVQLGLAARTSCDEGRVVAFSEMM